jgi:hypothetical protein
VQASRLAAVDRLWVILDRLIANFLKLPHPPDFHWR